MAEDEPLVVTISRQYGSGANAIGRQLAERLNMLFLDRDLIRRAAEHLGVPEHEVESRDETLTPFWQAVLESMARSSPSGMFMPVPVHIPPPVQLLTDQEVFLAQSQVIAQVAAMESAVIVGRAADYVLQDHPRHLSVFLFADQSYRLRRVEEIYHLSADEARARMSANDQARARFRREVTGRDWNDATQYHLCLDTSQLGVDGSVEVLLSYLSERFGV